MCVEAHQEKVQALEELPQERGPTPRGRHVKSEERQGQGGSPTNQTGAPSCQQSCSSCTPWGPRKASGGVPAQGRGGKARGFHQGRSFCRELVCTQHGNDFCDLNKGSCAAGKLP